MKTFIGYRSEEPYGSGVSDIKKIAIYEMYLLGNTDIMETLNKTRKQVMNYVRQLIRKGFTQAIWLCNKKQEVIDHYQASERSINKYTIKKGIILSDLGEEGKLIAYKPKNIK